ncbi:Nif3-like dinuclear metal center hexameric protein [Granulicella arctica]|uniref:Nif3-like dinuclear metal center hexameric protein n=1 Tax=Granulicella arctica TaxID=940613 RepID=UPI0021E06150|nr:Nif3-like dinuclear metal center hexameric protein [Granulicella arctica]
MTFLNRTATAQTSTPTAGEAWSRIQKFYLPAPPPATVDTLKAGDPATPVTGIVTTFLDTMAVLQEAVRLGDNLVISHEPTFYNHLDETRFFADDPVYQAKVAYIEQHHLVVYRLHDQIHADPAGDHILKGVYEALGWMNYPHPSGPFAEYVVTIPPTTLGELARTLERAFHIQTLRVEGDPKLPITHVALLPGAAGMEEQVHALNAPNVDVLIAGEAREWETVEYVRDASTQGRKKALILLGHEVSEEPGMERAAKELRLLFPGIRVDHVSAGQPLWSPEHPVAPAKF